MQRYEFKSYQCLGGEYSYTCIDILTGSELTISPEEWKKLKKIKIAELYNKEVQNDNTQEVH